jgi:hypothetical protein
MVDGWEGGWAGRWVDQCIRCRSQQLSSKKPIEYLTTPIGFELLKENA